MKNTLAFILLFVFAGIVISCTKTTTTATPVDNPPPIDTTISFVKYTGSFQNGPYGTASGTAKVILTNGKYQLRLEGFSVSSGPDLKVYLSKELKPLNFLRLGSLKSLNGDQVYDVPGNPNIMDYPYALIHCEKYNHLFGSAGLMKL